MPSFADSFWSGDYAGGLGVLFEKLQQGVIENQQVLQVAKLRADAEELYANKLAAIPAGSEKTGGFGKDDGASVRKAFDGLRKEMEDAGKNHRKVAENIRHLVVEPFSKWADAHEDRVLNSHDELQSRIKAYDKQHETVKKLRSHYFNRCRLVEDMEEETKFIQVPRPETPTAGTATATPQIKLQQTEEDDDEDQDPLEIGDEFIPPSEVKKLLAHMLEEIPQGEVKVAILGTYQNVSTGENIVQFIQKNMGASSISYAERIGQDLVSHGFLRLVGAVGNTFANSSKMNYQWRPKAFQFAGVTPKPADKSLKRAPTIHMNGKSEDAVSSPTTAIAIGDYLGNLLTNQHPGETQPQRLKREATEADEKYKASVRTLDLMRCELEESMVDHLKFMERCELDRLKAIKSVLLDFSGAISNVIPALQATVDRMMLYQETVQPLGDLRYLLESYRTGSYVPKVITYESYYNSPDEQTFGVDLEVRARADRKRVPVVVTSILTYLDHRYPDLEGDEARRGIWVVDVPLKATHHLRNAINNGKAPNSEMFDKYEIPIVASVLKQYFLELPDSLVSSHKYEIIKTVYTTHGGEGQDQARLAVIQNTLGSLPLTNIATLDAITTHFTRLIELTSADEAFVSTLAHNITNCILRPRVESSLTQHERHSYRLIRDLFTYKDQIFGELKRATISVGRQRSVSTDESNRKINMEARNRAVIATAKSRSSSPQPPRNRQASGSVDSTRFPINIATTSSPSTTSSPRSSGGKFGSRPQRDSLEVPSAPATITNFANLDPQPLVPTQLAEVDHQQYTHQPPPPPPQPLQDSNDSDRSGASSPVREEPIPARNSSLGRSARVSRVPQRKSGVLTRGVRPGSLVKRNSVVSSAGSDGGDAEFYDAAGGPHRGVTLTDRPMDD